MSVLDRRAAARYSINARLHWERVGRRDCGEGLTENISPIRLTMTLQRLSICVGGDGVVVRVEPREGSYGVGVAERHSVDPTRHDRSVRRE